MPNNEPTDRQLWFEDLKTYRQHETWAAGLALVGIALLTRQLAEWGLAKSTVNLSIPVSLAPAIIGLGVSIHLRIMNFRSRKVRWQMQPSEIPSSPGWYGRLMAWWPIGLGFGSFYFLRKYWCWNPSWDCEFIGVTTLWLAFIVLIEPVGYDFFWERWKKQEEHEAFTCRQWMSSWWQWAKNRWQCVKEFFCSSHKAQNPNSLEADKQVVREILQRRKIPERTIKEILAHLDSIGKGLLFARAHLEDLTRIAEQALFIQEAQEITLKVRRESPGHLGIEVLEISPTDPLS